MVVGLLAACLPPEDQEAPARTEARPVVDAADLPAFTDALEEVTLADLDREMALTLVAMPLSCLDRPHAAPRDRRTYLDTVVTSRMAGFEENRAFYGCWDWHSAVNSTWAMVRILRAFPDLPVRGLVEEKLNDHLSEKTIQGELAFFDVSRSFERPYGWAWLLYLHAELLGWDHPEAATWAGHVAPLAAVFSERMVEYLGDLRVPNRIGTHGNTAFSLAMMLEAARARGDRPLEQAVTTAALRLFEPDAGCPTAFEPGGSDFLSPCLEEAALMAGVMDPAAFLVWVDGFLPPLTSPAFRPLTMPIDPDDVVTAMEEVADTAGPGGAGDDESTLEERRDDAERRFLASASHLIGLAFIRADAMNRIAAALPPDDPRVPALRRIARLHGARGFDAMFDADYAGSHWIGTFALKYLLTERSWEEAGSEAIHGNVGR